MKLKASSCLAAFFSAAFQAFGLYHIHSVADITEGGVLGVTLLLEYWFGLSPAVSGFLLNGACFLLGWRILGKEFIAYSVVAAAGFSVGYGIFSRFDPIFVEIGGYPWIAAVVGALFIGIGAGICVRAGGATCGDDALAMSLSSILKVEIQWVYLFSDLLVLGLSVSYIPPEKVFWSLLSVILSGQIIGWIQKIKIPER